jgi:hypothetical protein
MRKATLRATDLMLLVGTRVALGVGVGLLLSTRLDPRARKAAGFALLTVGVLTTLPILLNVRATTRELREAETEGRGSVGSGSERRGEGVSTHVPM